MPLLTLLAVAATLHAAQPANPCARMRGHIVNQSGSRTTFVISDDARCLEVGIVGRVAFTDDDADVASLAPGGSFDVAESRGGTTRRLLLTERGGRIERAYSVNGVARPADEGASWLGVIVLDLVRGSGIGAEERVARIRRQRGTQGVLDEVARLRSDHVRRIYLTQLLAADLSNDEARRVAQTAERISSDHDRASVLRLVIERRGTDRGVAEAVVRAASSIGSDHDRSVVLRQLLDRGAADDAIVGRALQASTEIGSDHDRSGVLLSVVARGLPSEPASRDAFFRALDGMGSDHDRRRVLEAIAARDAVGADVLRALLASAARLGSDHDKSSVLLAVAARPERLRDAGTRAAFGAALKTVTPTRTTGAWRGSWSADWALGVGPRSSAKRRTPGDIEEQTWAPDPERSEGRRGDVEEKGCGCRCGGPGHARSPSSRPSPLCRPGRPSLRSGSGAHVADRQAPLPR